MLESIIGKILGIIGWCLLARNTYEVVLTQKGIIVAQGETLRVGVDLVASDVVRHAFNRYRVQLMTLILQRNTGKLRSSTS